MLMLLYPLEGEIEGYSREQFLADLCDEVEKDIRQAFAAGAERVSIDFTEGRLANKNDSRNPWTNKDMLQEFIDLNNRVIDRFSPEERKNIGIHTCPGGDMDSVHSKEVPYEKLLSKMFQLNVGLLPDPVRERGRQGEASTSSAGSTAATTPNGVPQVCFIGVINPLAPGGRDARAGARRAAQRGEAHPAGAPRRDRRLRLLPLQPRREAEARLAGLRARHRDAEDLEPRQGRRGWRPRSSGSRRATPAGREQQRSQLARRVPASWSPSAAATMLPFMRMCHWRAKASASSAGMPACSARSAT